MKLKWAAKPDEYAVRVDGRFALLGTRVYSEFMPKGVHGVQSVPHPRGLDDLLRDRPWPPGVRRPLLCACRRRSIPSSAGGRSSSTSFTSRTATRKIFAEEMVKKIGHRPVEYGIIDHRAGPDHRDRLGQARTSSNTRRRSRRSGFEFERGGHSSSGRSDDVKGGIEAVRNAMHVVDGKSRTRRDVGEGAEPPLGDGAVRYRKLPERRGDRRADQAQRPRLRLPAVPVHGPAEVREAEGAEADGQLHDEYLEAEEGAGHAKKSDANPAHGGSIKMW